MRGNFNKFFSLIGTAIDEADSNASRGLNPENAGSTRRKTIIPKLVRNLAEILGGGSSYYSDPDPDLTSIFSDDQRQSTFLKMVMPANEVASSYEKLKKEFDKAKPKDPSQGGNFKPTSDNPIDNSASLYYALVSESPDLEIVKTISSALEKKETAANIRSQINTDRKF